MENLSDINSSDHHATCFCSDHTPGPLTNQVLLNALQIISFKPYNITTLFCMLNKYIESGLFVCKFYIVYIYSNNCIIRIMKLSMLLLIQIILPHFIILYI